MCTPGNCHLLFTNPLDKVHLLTLAPQRCKGTVDSLKGLSNKPLAACTAYNKHPSGANHKLCILWAVILELCLFCYSLSQSLMRSLPKNV